MTELETMLAMLKHAEIEYGRHMNDDVKEWPQGATVLTTNRGDRGETCTVNLIFTRDGDLFSIEAYE